jgi:sugar (pentulose or hexulose) kinase
VESENLLAVGLDVGTGGVRALALDLSGRVVAAGRAEFPPESRHADGVVAEQDPRAWTTAAQVALSRMTAVLPAGCRIVGIAVDATSGTFLLADAENRPLTAGIMYNDLRAAAQAERAAAALRGTLWPFGIEIAPAFALPKILHLAATQPEVFARCRRVLHQTDYVVGMLTGRYDVTDVSTALKTGVNPGTLDWPMEIERDLGLARALLPRVVLPGTVIGEVTRAAAEATGLPSGTPVVAGCTDGTAGFLASGASVAGDLNVTLGSTLVFKAVSTTPLVDPAGAVYNHRHPAGGYLPGAASNTGGAWVGDLVGKGDLDQLGTEAARLLPTRRIVYPLTQTGERFPFASPVARGFGFDEIASPSERFAAGMEGTAYVERLAIERLESLGLPGGPTVYATGGGAWGRTWLRIRAAVTRREYAVPEQPECAVGAAVLAAAPGAGGVTQAARMLVRLGQRVEPEDRLAEVYDAGFLRFKAALQRRGYLPS